MRHLATLAILVLLGIASMVDPAAAQHRAGDLGLEPPDLETAPPPPEPIGDHDVLCERAATYRLVWGDGREGILSLARPVAPDFAAVGYLAVGPSFHGVRHEVVVNPQDLVGGEQGPGYRGADSALGHRVVFWVDFDDTPADARDDARFDGYLMTVTRDSMAGVTWFGDVPYGFYATDKTCTEWVPEPIR